MSNNQVVHLHLEGSVFTTTRDTLQRFPNTRLGRLVAYNSDDVIYGTIDDVIEDNVVDEVDGSCLEQAETKKTAPGIYSLFETSVRCPLERSKTVAPKTKDDYSARVRCVCVLHSLASTEMIGILPVSHLDIV